ncbi:MAG: hypothetical protein KIS79_16335 [Burkholderiales bacterium]|nr:hypothetical protein [Burkholderiales bacterium]
MTMLRLKFHVHRILLAALILGPAAISPPLSAAEKKMTGTGIFISMAGRQVGYEADDPKREMVQWTAIWTFTSSDPDFDGIIETAPTQSICGPGGCRHHGHLTFRHRNGDQSWGYFYGTHEVTAKGDGTWTLSSDGVKVLLGGTGKFANIKGQLKYAAKNVPFGATFNWTGQVDY